jgi:hypothetical protein
MTMHEKLREQRNNQDKVQRRCAARHAKNSCA